MGSVWKRLQRYNKRAAKFKFTLSYSELDLVCSPSAKWLPSKVAILLTRRSRRFQTTAQPWEPSLASPYEGNVNWSNEVQELFVTLFHDAKSQNYEGKDWNLVIEEVSNPAKARHLGTFNLDMSAFVTGATTQRELRIVFKNLSKKIKSATLRLQLTSVFLKEGKATDEDMQSVASLMSAAPLDINPEEDDDIEDEDAAEKTSQSEAATLEECCSQIFDETTNTDHHSSMKDVTSFFGLEDPLKNVEVPEAPLSLIQVKEKLESNSPIPTTVLELGGVESKNETPAELRPKYGAVDEGRIVSARSVLKNREPVKSATDSNDEEVGDLLAWCKNVTAGYAKVVVGNFTTSWRNGLAFCAIINKFRPDLINFDELRAEDIRGNCKKAFDAAEQLGIPRVIEPSEMVFLNIPDKLAVMTYLHQLKTYFEAADKILPSASATSAEPPVLLSDETSSVTTEEKVEVHPDEVKQPMPVENAAPIVLNGSSSATPSMDMAHSLQESEEVKIGGEELNRQSTSLEQKPPKVESQNCAMEPAPEVPQASFAELAGPPPVHIHRRFPDGLAGNSADTSPTSPDVAEQSSLPTSTQPPLQMGPTKPDEQEEHFQVAPVVTPVIPVSPPTPRRGTPDIPDVVQRPPRKRAESATRGRTKRVSFSNDVPPNPTEPSTPVETPSASTEISARPETLPQPEAKPAEESVETEKPPTQKLNETPVDPQNIPMVDNEEELLTTAVQESQAENLPRSIEDQKPPAEMPSVKTPQPSSEKQDVPDVIKTVTEKQENVETKVTPKPGPIVQSSVPKKASSLEPLAQQLQQNPPVPIAPTRRRRISQTSLPQSASATHLTTHTTTPFTRSSTSPMSLHKSRSTGFQRIHNLTRESPLSGSKQSLPTTIDFDQPLVISIPIGTVPRNTNSDMTNELKTASPGATDRIVPKQKVSPPLPPSRPPPIAKPARTSLINRSKAAETNKQARSEPVSVSVILPQASAVCLPISDDSDSLEVKKEPIYATVDVSHKKKPDDPPSDCSDKKLTMQHDVVNHPLIASDEEIIALEDQLADKELKMKDLAKEIGDLKAKINDAKKRSALRATPSPSGAVDKGQEGCSFCHKFFAHVIRNYQQGRLQADREFMLNLARMYDAFSKENSSEQIVPCRLHLDLVRQIRNGLGQEERPPVKIPRTNSSAAKLRAQRMIELSRAATAQVQAQQGIAYSRERDSSPVPSITQKTKSMYIQHELESLEWEQAQIDQEASRLEKKIREVMGSSNNKAEEERLLMKWFSMVNKKSALLRRQMQLNILEKEENLERRLDLLTGELREILDIEDSRKTDAQREREQLLLNELVDLVNKRDELVRHMHMEEQEMEEEKEIALDVYRDLSHPEDPKPAACVIQ